MHVRYRAEYNTLHALVDYARSTIDEAGRISEQGGQFYFAHYSLYAGGGGPLPHVYTAPEICMLHIYRVYHAHLFAFGLLPPSSIRA